MLGWACAIGILGLSAQISCNSEFFYSQNIFRRFDVCNLCFEKDCLTFDKPRCDYYAEADSILPKDEKDPGGIEDAGKRKEVDDLIFDLMHKGLSKNMECIPYVSRYTNCNKDNVCLDCKTCACNPEGMWNCSTLQPCHSQTPPLHIDHRVLVMIMEALTDNTHLRKTKRSVTDNPKDAGSTISLDHLSEWLYGVKPLNMKKINQRDITSTTDFAVIVEDDEPASEIATTVTDPTLSGLITTGETETTTSEDTDYVAFDEVLRSIAVDPTTYNRKMPLDNEQLDNIIKNQTFSADYMIMDEENSSNGHFGDVINSMLTYDDVVTVTESKVTSATEVVIDLLNSAGKLANVNVSEDYTNYNKDEDPSIFENSNDIIQYNALHIIKRDVTGLEQNTTPNMVPTVTIAVNTTDTTITNHTEEPTDLQENVLIPLNKIITDKLTELESLQKIKTDLLKYVKNNSHPDDIPIKENATSNTYFSIYKVAMATGLDVDLRRANPSRYEKYMLKLKYDIIEVIRDIAGIQKYKNLELPEDLKRLMHAMKRYVYRNQLVEKPKRNKVRRQQFFRRNMEQRTSRCDRLSYKDCLVQLIEVIDKDIPKSNALSPLSPASRKIMKHVIKSYYVDQLIMPGLRAYDPYYNLTVYLNSIGSKWQEETANLISRTPFASLHRMKLLHCTLTLDISKLNDAIARVEFAHSRRMDSTLDKVNDDTLDRIDARLIAIHNKILMLIKYYKQIPKPAGTKQPRAEIKKTTTRPRPSMATKDPAELRQTKKRSFIKHIRSLLKTSKKDITELLHRKVPKSEIVRQLAKKRLDEISEKRYAEYEETMRRWQKNLELGARMKRSVLDQVQTRMKNIIPRYLRHKLKPRIKENKKNATAEATRKADDKKKKRKASRRDRKVRKITTPRSRKPATSRTKRVTTDPTAHTTITRARKPTTSTVL